MTEPNWILERDVRAIHDRLLVLDGGAAGVRDAGLLASALARPQQHHTYEHTTDIVRLAALSCEVTVLDMNGPPVAKCANGLGVRAVPAVVIDGKLGDCCAGRGPDRAVLRAAGVGQAT